MALPSDNGIFIHKGINCTPNYVPTAQSIPMSPTDSTSVKNKIDTKSDLSNIANIYDPTDTYAEDDCVIYEGVLYQCVNSSGTTGTWVPADWTPVKAVDVGSGGGGGSSSASHVSYNNTIVTPSSQRLSGTNVQDAIDEVVERTWEGTLAQYEAITTKDPNTVYYVTDGILPSVKCFSIINGAINITFDDGTT